MSVVANTLSSLFTHHKLLVSQFSPCLHATLLLTAHERRSHRHDFPVVRFRLGEDGGYWRNQWRRYWSFDDRRGPFAVVYLSVNRRLFPSAVTTELVAAVFDRLQGVGTRQRQFGVCQLLTVLKTKKKYSLSRSGGCAGFSTPRVQLI